MARKIILVVVILTFIFKLQNVWSDEMDGPETFVLTPSGYRELAINYPGNVTVITEEDIKNSNAKYIYELLRKEAGVYVSDYTHAGKTVLVDMRGFGETAGRNVLVMLDGRRMNEIDISGTDWSQVPLENVERIEIVRGSGSVLYGDNAAAGVINIITKKGRKGHHFKIGAEYGSYRYHNFYGNLNGAEEFASYNIFYKQEKTDGFRLNGDYDGYDFMGSVMIYPTDMFNLEVSGGYHKDWYGMPAGLQRWEMDRLGYNGSTTPGDGARTETTFIRVMPSFRFSWDSMDHELVLDAWGRKKWLSTTTWAHFLPFTPWYASWDTSQIDSRGGSAKYINTFYIKKDIVSKFVAGVDLFTAHNHLLTVTPQWGTYNQLTIRKRTLGIYINDRIEVLKKIILNGGFRQEWASYVFDQSENAARYETKNPDQEAFDLGIEYKYLGNGGIYGRFSRSYRFPSTEEFYSRWTGLNTNLEHQRNDTWEVGIKDENWQYLQPFLNFFWIRTDNEIFYDPIVGAFGDNRNYDKTKRFGIEAGAESDPFEWLNIYLNYTYLNAEYDGGKFAGNNIPMVPEHKISWGVNITPMEYIELNFASEYASSQYSINDDANKLTKLKPYFVCNGKVVFKYNGVEVFFGINNIFDSRYSEIASSNVAGTVTDFHPAPDRNYVIGASCEF